MPDKHSRRSSRKPNKESKMCAGCGITFHNRKKWASRGLWATVQYCSERCRRTARNAPTDKASI